MQTTASTLDLACRTSQALVDSSSSPAAPPREPYPSERKMMRLLVRPLGRLVARDAPPHVLRRHLLVVPPHDLPPLRCAMLNSRGSSRLHSSSMTRRPDVDRRARAVRGCRRSALVGRRALAGASRGFDGAAAAQRCSGWRLLEAIGGAHGQAGARAVERRPRRHIGAWRGGAGGGRAASRGLGGPNGLQGGDFCCCASHIQKLKIHEVAKSAVENWVGQGESGERVQSPRGGGGADIAQNRHRKAPISPNFGLACSI